MSYDILILGELCGVDLILAEHLSRRAFLEKVPAQDLLHWELMGKAKKKGCHLFDLTGVNPHPENNKEAGIRRFKEKWGGTYREYHRHQKEMPFRRTLLEKTARTAYGFLKALRKP